MASQKEIVNYYFKRKEDSDLLFECRCGKVRKQDKLRGHGNLMDHITRDHKHYLEEVRNNAGLSLQLLSPNISDKFMKIYQWLDWVRAGLPFSFCEKNLTKKYTNLPEISAKTLVSYMNKMVSTVEKEISEKLPQFFGLMIDGWTEMGSSTHYLGVFGLFSDKSTGQSVCPLLAFSPLIDESSYTTDSHIAFLEFVLNVYDKSIQNVKFLVCDNENLNKSISRKLNVPMIGCASHRLNLAVKAALIDAQEEMDLVMKLMKKFLSLKQSAKLRKATNLRPVLRNETRWSSAYSMLQRYFDIQHFVDKTDPELLQLLPTQYKNVS